MNRPLAVAAALALAASLRAAPSDDIPDVPPPGAAAAAAEPPSFTDRTSEAFSKLSPLINSEKWDAALAILNDAQSAAPPDSYDLAVILDTKARLLLKGKSDYPDAIPLWEEALALYRRHPGYYRRDDVLQMLTGLAQMHYQVGAALKDRAAQLAHFQRAVALMRHWMRSDPRPSADEVQFYASLLYYTAVANPAQVDRTELAEAERAAQMGLELAVKPRAGFYQLLLAAAQQRDDLARVAEYLELLVALPGDPAAKRTYWPDLVAVYETLAAAEKSPREQRRRYADAVNALERAEQAGDLASSSDHYTRARLYYQAGDVPEAIDLLREGLRSGGIANTLENWKTLSFFYEDEGRENEAIGALREAEIRFPHNGGIDFSISELYEGLDRNADAFDYAGRALRRGGLGSRRVAAYQHYIWLAYDLRRYPDALRALAESKQYPECRSDPELQRLERQFQQLGLEPAAPSGTLYAHAPR